ncbi:MAG: RDD family protein, partial [bacterium]
MSQESVNPYAAPEAVSNPLDIENKSLQPCYSDRRLLNLFIDYICYIIFAFGIGIVIGKIGGEAALDAIDQIPSFIFGMIIISIYYILFEATTGRTPAKYITGTMVVTVDGKKPEFGQIIIRTLCRFI